jgi:hypothetical protein
MCLATQCARAWGRAGEAPSTGLTEVLVGLGFETDRLKTGTPARVDSRTVNFSVLQAQPGDSDVRWFSFDTSVGALLQETLCNSAAAAAGGGGGTSGGVLLHAYAACVLLRHSCTLANAHSCCRKGPASKRPFSHVGGGLYSCYNQYQQCTGSCLSCVYAKGCAMQPETMHQAERPMQHVACFAITGALGEGADVLPPHAHDG